MKAMVLHKNASIHDKPLQLMDLPTPQPGAKQVRLKVHCCAVCRTDLHVIEGDLPVQQLPIVPGHQIVGTVDAHGPGCSRFKLGQRIGVAWLRHTCGQCRFCRAGQENLCESSRYTGYHENGGYAEYAVVHEDFAYAIPDAFDDVSATPLLCAGIIGYRALQRSQLPPGGTLAIYGFGSSAHMILPVALHRGCRVFVVTRSEGHRKLAHEMGAEWVGEDAQKMPEKADSAIIFAPVGDLVPTALQALRKGGTLALAGIYMSPIPEMDYEQNVFYERDIHSVTANTRHDGQNLLKEAAQIPLRPHTTRYPLKQANRALIDLKNDQINGTGVLTL
jgi:propanol-preferring alcohol dehydrogenase